MLRFARWSACVLLTVGLLAFFTSLYATMHVRNAIAGGALDNPGHWCLTARDRATLEAGPNQKLADHWIWRQVYEYHIGEQRSPGVGLRGAIANYGTQLTYTKSQRIELAYASMEPLRTCGNAR